MAHKLRNPSAISQYDKTDIIDLLIDKVWRYNGTKHVDL